jgi:hypothetical protein
VLISTDGTDVEQAQFAFNNLTTAGSADSAADSVAVFDASAAAMREILLDDLGITGAGAGAGGGGASNPADWEVISETSHSGAATVDLAFDPTIYEEIEITLRGITVSTDGTDLEFNVTDDTFVGIETGASAYSWGLTGVNPEGPTANVTGDDADSEIKFTPPMDGTAAESRGYARILIGEPGGDGDKQFFSFASGTNTTPNGRGFFGHSLFKDNTNAIDGIRVKTGGGNFAAEITVRGRRINPLVGAVGLIGPLLHVRDEKTSGSGGGASASAARQVRTLDDVVTNEIDGASVGSNQITLPAGDYLAMCSAPAYQAGEHQLFLDNTTDTVDELIGQTAVAAAADTTQTMAFVSGKFSIAGEKVFELEHYTAAVGTLGQAVGDSATEVYADCKFWKQDEGRSGANPDWEHIETITASTSSSIDFAEFDETLYDEIELTGTGVTLSADDTIAIRISLDGTTFRSTSGDYGWVSDGRDDAGTVAGTGSASDTEAEMFGIDGGASTSSGAFYVRFGALDNTATHKYWYWNSSADDGTPNLSALHGAGQFVGTTGAVEALQVITLTAATIDTGTFTLRGRRKSPQTGPTLSGQWEKITRVEEAGAATMDFDWTPGNYEIIRLECSQVQPATDNRDLYLRVRQGGTAQSGASDYSWAGTSTTHVLSPSVGPLGDDNDAQIVMFRSMGDVAGETGAFELTLYDPDSAENKRITWSGQLVNLTPVQAGYTGSGAFDGNATAVDGLQLLGESASNIAGNCTLLGRRR